MKKERRKRKKKWCLVLPLPILLVTEESWLMKERAEEGRIAEKTGQ